MNDWGDLADSFLKACAHHKILVATAESCTGGMIISLLTDIPGSSSMVDRGFVTYSNEAKTEMLGVPPDTLERHGAVSAETAHEMAEGALKNSRAGITLAVTGIAGPTGGTADKPVGLVHFAVARHDGRLVHREERFGDIGRDSVRLESVRTALRMMAEMLA